MRLRRSVRRGVAALAVVLSVGGLVFAGPAALSPAAAAPGPPAYPQYWFDQWGIPALWASGARGQGVTVAVVDTGVSSDPPELSGHVLSGTDLTGEGGDGRIDRAEDAFSHGTAMASIIVAQGGPVVVGVAPGAKILPVAVPLEQTTAAVHADRTATAIDYAADHGARIVNMSFGAQRREGVDDVACPADVQASVFRALAKGVILVASAGNSGQRGNPVEDPSVCIGVVSVAAVDAQDRRASFSSEHRYNTVAAPGVDVVSAGRTPGDYFVGAGTSQAAALTSGALALMWSAHPKESNRQILARMFAGLRAAGPPGRDRLYGYGIVDAGASVRATVSAASANPVWTAAAPFLAARAAPAGPALSPPRAARTDASVPAADRDAPPGPLTTRSLQGLGLGGIGIVLLAVLLVGGWLTRRRPTPTPIPVRVPQPGTWWESSTSPDPGAAAPGLGASPSLSWSPRAEPPNDAPPGWFAPGPPGPSGLSGPPGPSSPPDRYVPTDRYVPPDPSSPPDRYGPPGPSSPPDRYGPPR